MAEFYCLLCLFLLETAVICSYWYISRVSLKSAPRYVNAMRPGRTITLSPRWKRPAEAVLPSPAEEINQPQELLIQFCSAIIESVLCTSITVWFSSATKSNLRRLWRVVRTAERIIGTTLPTLQELYSSRVSKRAGKITLDPSHPHFLFELLPSSWCYRALSTRMTRHRNSFFPLKLSISWSLEFKHGTHSTIIQLFVHQTHLFFHFKFAHVRPHT